MIWKTYFYKEILKSFSFLLFCFFAFFVLIDYASHSSHHYHHASLNSKELLKHYANEFSLRAHVLIPFALLLATIRTLLNLNIQNELLALMAAGISTKTLLRPFLWVGLFWTVFLFWNTEFLLPSALKKVHHLRDEKMYKKEEKKFAVQHLALKDQTILLFQSYNSEDHTFFDAYWIRSFDDIWKIHSLNASEKISQGTWVDHLVRNEKGILEQKEWFEERLFPEIHFDKRKLTTLIPPEELPLSALWKKSIYDDKVHSKQNEWNGTFLHKMVLPWLALFAVLAPAPFCLRRSRVLHPLLFYACALFGLTACYLILSTGKELATRQLLPAIWAIGIPFGIILGIPIINFIRIR